MQILLLMPCQSQRALDPGLQIQYHHASILDRRGGGKPGEQTQSQPRSYRIQNGLGGIQLQSGLPTLQMGSDQALELLATPRAWLP